ncbi:hypothetical protein THRCLA_04708 [Thraustotheca clavata]|uniref:BZIP domain-containing protein n=1 Tax=Thraustotheca clavata TaxID=74557 RepID=A0A1V9ZYD3_9STRA|nr:hypothetical protein THRCLA_04708 [Thraustotheca clavata]
MDEEWIPNDDDIASILAIDRGYGQAPNSNSKKRKCDDRSDESSSEDDGADLEMEMERQMQRQVQDVHAIRRLKHRIISRKSRAKKKRDMEALAAHVQELEAKVKQLQASSSVALVSTSGVVDRKTAYLRLFQEADRLREENRNLQQAIDKHVGFATSVQSSIAAVEKWEKENIVLAALCDFVVFHALSTVQYECLRQKVLNECNRLLQHHGDNAHVFQGWTDHRRLEFPPQGTPYQPTNLSQPNRIAWVSSKTIVLPRQISLRHVMEKTWNLYHSLAACQTVIPHLRKLEVLQTINDDAFVVRRDFLFPHAKTQRVHYTTLLVLRESSSDGGYTLSMKTMDSPITDEPLGDSEAWLSECVEITLQPTTVSSPQDACHVVCRGYQDYAIPSYAKAAMVELLAVLLKWEDYVQE